MMSSPAAPDSQLRHWQQDFIQAALKADRPAAIVLEAATGMGILRALAGLVQEVMQREVGGARILFLTPDFLVENVVGALGRHNGVSAIAIGGELFRELSLGAADQGEIWPRGVPLVGGFRWARLPTRYKAIKASEWDLVVVDQAHRWGDDLLDLIDSKKIDLAVVVSNVSAPGSFDSIPGAQVVRWDLSQLDRATADSVAARRASRAIAGYRRSEPEKQLLTGLGELTRSFWDQPGDWLRSDLTAAAITSPMMLEATLMDLEVGLSTAAAAGGPDADYVNIKLPDSFARREVQVIEPMSAIREHIAHLLNALYDIPGDPKCEALKKLLGRLWRDQSVPMLVVTADPATATYISEVLGTNDQFMHVETRMPPAERLDRLARSGLRAAVASDSAVAGFELSGRWRIINYDLPRTEAAMEARWLLLPELGAKVMWALADLERSIRLERELLELHGF